MGKYDSVGWSGRNYQNSANAVADAKDYFRGYGQVGYSRYDNSTSSVELGEGLRSIIAELKYVNELYDRLEPQAYRAGASLEAQEIIPAVEKRLKLLENTKEKLEKQREKAVILEVAENAANQPDFAQKARYNENAEDTGKHFWSVNSGNSALDMGFLSEEQTKNLPATRASETDRTYGDFIEALDYSAFGGNVRTAWFMTPKEVGIYNYLTETMGGKAADKYFESIEQELNDRRTDWSTREAQRVAKEDEFASSLATVVATPARDVTSVIGNVNDVIKTAKGEEISPNDAFKQSNLATRNIRGTVSEDMGNVGKFLYDGTMNAGDGLTRLPFRFLGNTMSASSAMQDGVIDTKNAGMSDKQAVGYGVGMGFLDYAIGKDTDKKLGKIMTNKMETPSVMTAPVASNRSAFWRGGITKGTNKLFQSKKDELYSLVRGTDKESSINNILTSNPFRRMNDDDKNEVVVGLTDYLNGNMPYDDLYDLCKVKFK